MCKENERDELEQYLEYQGLFCSSQHGFRKGRLCRTQLLEMGTAGDYSRLVRYHKKLIKAKLTLYIWSTEKRLTECLMKGFW